MQSKIMRLSLQPFQNGVLFGERLALEEQLRVGPNLSQVGGMHGTNDLAYFASSNISTKSSFSATVLRR